VETSQGTKKKEKQKAPINQVTPPESEPVLESDSNKYFTETQGDDVSDTASSPKGEDLLATPKVKTTQNQPTAFLESGSGLLEEDSARCNLLEELQTDNEDSDKAGSSASGLGHRSRPSLTEAETQARSDRKKTRLKPKSPKRKNTRNKIQIGWSNVNSIE
jgi:hypothetical protein